MKKVIVYAPSVADFAMRYIEAVRQADFEPLLVLCRGAQLDIPESTGVPVEHIEALSREPSDEVQAFAADKSIAGIVPGGEFAVEASEYIARGLGLVRGMLGDPAVLRNKHRMRIAFDRAGVSQPRLLGVVKNLEEAEAVASAVQHFPVVSKPVDAAGSWHVFRSSSREELLGHVAPVFDYTSSKLTGLSFAGTCLIEEYVEGDEYSAEVIVQSGRVVDCFVNRKFVSAPPHFDEVGHLSGASLGIAASAALRDNIERIIAAAQVHSTVLHVEFKLTPHNRLAIIEVAGRIAGDHIAALVEMQYGVSLERAMVDLRTGRMLRSVRRDSIGRHGIRFLFHEGGQFSLDVEKVVSRHMYPVRPVREEFSATHLTNRVGHEIFFQAGNGEPSVSK